MNKKKVDSSTATGNLPKAGFKNIALRKFTKEIKPKYGDDWEFTIVLCSDTDVFDFAPKPPIKWD